MSTRLYNRKHLSATGTHSQLSHVICSGGSDVQDGNRYLALIGSKEEAVR